MGALIVTAVGFVIAWFIGNAGGHTTQVVMLVLLALFGLGRAWQVSAQNVVYHPRRSWGLWWAIAATIAFQFAARVVLLVAFLTGSTTFGTSVWLGLGATIVGFVAILPAIALDKVYIEESNAVIAEREAIAQRRRFGL